MGIDEGIGIVYSSGGGGWSPEPLDPNNMHYVLSFKDSNDNNLFSPLELNANSEVDLSAFVPVDRTGYTFNGWDDGNDNIITSVIMNADTTVFASYSANIYNLTLTDDSGTNVIAKAYGAAITETPTARTGYAAWWVPALPATMPSSNLSATAEYSNVTKNLITVVDGVSTTIAYYVGQTLDVADPEKPGYIFTGWNPELPSVMPDENLTVTATFEETVYTVYYRNTDQSIYTSQTYHYNDEIIEPTEPTYANDYFWDWDGLPDEMPPATFTVDALAFPKSTTVYGLEGDLSVASSSAYTYLYNAANMLPIRVDSLNNFNNFNDNSTSWKTFIYQYVKPCMLKRDGTVDYYLDRDDQSKKDDGVTASDISNANYEGNAMVEFKKLWSNARRIRGTNKYRLIISPNEIPNITFAEAFKRADGTYVDQVYYAMFNASAVTDGEGYARGASLNTGSIDITNSSANNIAALQTKAKANGAGWDFAYEALTQHIYKMLFMVSKTFEPYGALYNKDNITFTTGGAYDNRQYGVENGCFFVKSLVTTNKLIKLLWLVDFFGSRAVLQTGAVYYDCKFMLKYPPFPEHLSLDGYQTIFTYDDNTGYKSTANTIFYTRLNFYKGIAYESKFSATQPSYSALNETVSVCWLGINSGYRSGANKNNPMYSSRNFPVRLDRYTDGVTSSCYHHCGWNGNTMMANNSIWSYRLSYVEPSASVLQNFSLQSIRSRMILLETNEELTRQIATPSIDLGGNER